VHWAGGLSQAGLKYGRKIVKLDFLQNAIAASQLDIQFVNYLGGTYEDSRKLECCSEAKECAPMTRKLVITFILAVGLVGLFGLRSRSQTPVCECQGQQIGRILEINDSEFHEALVADDAVYIGKIPISAFQDSHLCISIRDPEILAQAQDAMKERLEVVISYVQSGGHPMSPDEHDCFGTASYRVAKAIKVRAPSHAH
jgi:hypothetical protein